MSEQSNDSMRYSHPTAGEVPGADDMRVAPDAAMASLSEGYGDPQELDPEGHPHAPSTDVPRIRTDAPGEGGQGELMQPEMAPGPGLENAQVEPADEEERKKTSSA